MTGVTLFAVLSWWLTPKEAWLSKKHLTQFLEADTNAGEEVAGDPKDIVTRGWDRSSVFDSSS
jgi:hypothetical protein